MAQDTSRMTDDAHHGRVGGSGFTWFQFNGKVVAFAQALSHTSPAPVADPVAVQPLNWRRPAEIVVPRAIGMGTLTVTGIELWNQSLWMRLPGLENAIDLADVFQLMWNRGNADLTASIVVDPPPGKGSSGGKYFRTYHGIKVSNIDDSENIDITTMLLNKTVTFVYAYVTRQGKFAGPASARFPSEISTG